MANITYPAPPPYSAVHPGYASVGSSQPRFFHIVSRLSGLVLAVQGGTGCAGSRVSTWYRKTTDNNDQLWYEDSATGTIRSTISNNCMEISGNGATLVVNPYAVGNPNQQWMVVADKIQCRHDPNKVLGIAGEQRTPDATISAWPPYAGISQSWTLEYANPETPPQPFFLKSKMNNLVLGVEGGSGAPGSRVITAFQKQSGYNDDQLWYEDAATGTIRTKINYYCMEMPVSAMTTAGFTFGSTGQGLNLVVNPYAAGNPNQQWMVVGDKIQCRHDIYKVLDIANEQQTPGALIRSWKPHGRPSQLWTLEYPSPSEILVSSVDAMNAATQEAAAYMKGFMAAASAPVAAAPAPMAAAYAPALPAKVSMRRSFYIRSEMHGKILDISGGNTKPGAKLMMYDKGNTVANNQLWYLDDSAVIRSSLNDFAVDPTGNATTMQPYVASNPNHQWLYDGKKIYNRTTPNQVLDIRGANKEKWADVIKYPYKGSANQHWALDYV